MSSRRAADAPAPGQPDTKRPKTDSPAGSGGGGALDIAAIRAQIAIKKAEAEARLRGAAASATGSGGGEAPRRIDPPRERAEQARDNGWDRSRSSGGGDRDGHRDRDREKERDHRSSNAGRNYDERDRDRDRDRERERDRNRGYDRSRNDDRHKGSHDNRDRDGARASGGPATSTQPRPAPDASVQERLAAAKARIDALNSKMTNPYTRPAGPFQPKPAASTSTATSSSAAPPGVGGLSSAVALHPLLMADSTGAGGAGEKNEKKAMRDRYKTMAPKFSSVRANQGVVAAAAAAAKAAEAATPAQQAKPAVVGSLNPYLSGGLPGAAGVGGADAAAGGEGVGAGGGGDGAAGRRSRQLQFARPGRFVEQGDQLRNEAKMEALKQRIAEASKKAGLDSEFDTLERSLKRQPPPDVEWWDKALLPAGSTYADLDTALPFLATSEDSLITHLIQHPIPIPAPGDRKQPERGMMLTKKEQKKMRRQRRLAELEDKRDRQKMGLLPPDPPKVRLANLMKVLTSDAVQDPTKVEAKVRKEVAARATKHEEDNAERKLTAEQRKEKEYKQMVSREAKGIHAAVFKIKYLTNGRHKFKVRETAHRDVLSGICLFNPNFALVLVEGVEKSIKHYKNLLLRRIDWTEQARPLGEGGAEGDGEGSDSDADADGKEGGDLADNKCELIWEGEVPDRTFKMFRARHAESDGKAKEWLTPKWEGMWDLAKRWQWQGEEL